MMTFFKWILFIFACLPGVIGAKALSVSDLIEVNRQYLLRDTTVNTERIRNAKIALMQGKARKAISELRKVEDPQLDKVVFWLMSLAEFSLGHDKKALEILQRPAIKKIDNFPYICHQLVTLQLINGMAVDELNYTYQACRGVTENYMAKEDLWITTLMNIKNNKKDGLNLLAHPQYDLWSNARSIQLWLKLGLYLNLEKKMRPYLKNLPDFAYENQQIRELLGILHYRLGDEELAFELVEDLIGPNAENIKGNLKLKRGQYELAYGHFMLALKAKSDSLNALERILPLAWTLKKWDEGIKALKSIPLSDEWAAYRESVMTGLLIRNQEYKKAQRLMNYLEKYYQGLLPIELLEAKSYLAIQASDLKEFEISAHEACRKLDGLSCWLQMQLFVWEDFSKTFKEEEDILPKTPVNYEDLVAEVKIKPIDEEVYFKQKEIEDLDERDFNILFRQLYDR